MKKMVKKAFAVCISLLIVAAMIPFSTTAYAEGGKIIMTFPEHAVLGGSGSDYAKHIIKTDSGYIVCGEFGKGEMQVGSSTLKNWDNYPDAFIAELDNDLKPVKALGF